MPKLQQTGARPRLERVFTTSEDGEIFKKEDLGTFILELCRVKKTIKAVNFIPN